MIMMTKINNSVKWLGAALLFTLHSSLFTSCSDFLQIEPREIIVLDKYWDEEADVDGVGRIPFRQYRRRQEF